MSALYEKFAGNNAAAPVLFLVLFLVIVGGALYLTPRIARWIEQRQKKNPGFYEGMLTEDPNTPEKTGEDGKDAAGKSNGGAVNGRGGLSAAGDVAGERTAGEKPDGDAAGNASGEVSSGKAGTTEKKRHGTD